MYTCFDGNCESTLICVRAKVIDNALYLSPSNKCSQITDFLSNLTLKTKAEKDHFFRGLARDLFSLPPVVLAEHMVPLLLTPLVMAEPVAAEALWQHLLLPCSSQHPQGKVFDEAQPCPLLQEDLFK